MLLNMFTHESKAFYQFGKIVELKKLPVDIFSGYIESGLKGSGIEFKSGVPGKIIEICEGIPHYVQYLASGAWEEAIENKSRLDDAVLERAVVPGGGADGGRQFYAYSLTGAGRRAQSTGDVHSRQ
jgi:hypothetical protein